MELGIAVAQQVLVMFILLGVGVLLAKTKQLDKIGTAYLSNVLLYAIGPAIMINAFQIEFSVQKLKGLLFAMALAILSHAVSIVFNKYLVFRKKDENTGINRFSVIYTNAGFIGIPLLQACLGTEGVFYLTAYLVMFNILMWTHGVYELCDCSRDKLSIKAILFNPGVISVVIGFVLYVIRVTLPIPIAEAMTYIANTNTAVALIVCGVFIAGMRPVELFTDKRALWVSFIRLIVTPLLVLGVFKLLQVDRWMENSSMMITVIMIATACPTAIAASFMAQRFEADGEFGGKVASITTLLCIVTTPIFAMLTSIIFP